MCKTVALGPSENVALVAFDVSEVIRVLAEEARRQGVSLPEDETLKMFCVSSTVGQPVTVNLVFKKADAA